MRRCTDQLDSILQFVAHLRQGLFARQGGYLYTAECRAGVANKPSAFSLSAESAGSIHGGKAFFDVSVSDKQLRVVHSHDEERMLGHALFHASNS
jgi:hypothetical protein